VFSQKLKLFFAPLAWRTLCSTLSIPAISPKIPLAEGPIIFACLHRDILGSILYVRPAKPWLLVSSSDDGKILTRTLGRDDYGFVQGATGENGSRALVRLRRVLEKGQHIGVAVDGPKGPFGEIQSGVFHLAKMTGASIAPLLPVVKPALVLGTWDRTVVPYLFSSIQVAVGPIMNVPPDATDEDFDVLRRKLGEFFQPGKGPLHEDR
jgi:lysophospholipid acyltransferase (LPLAT)-like uncharacterized protein